MRKKLLILLLLLFAIIYVGTWLAYGEETLLKRDIHLVWTDRDLQIYASEAPLFLCTNLTTDREISHDGRTAQVLSWYECRQDGRFKSIQDSVYSKAANLNADKGDKGIVIAYAVSEVSTPLATRNGVGYWFYGTDHIKSCEEWIVWGFTGWFVIYEKNKCGLSER